MVSQLAADGAKVTAFDANFPVPEKNSAVEALGRLEEEVRGNAAPDIISKIREIETSSDDDAAFADAIKRSGNVVLGHMFLDAERAKSVDAKGAEQYFEVLSAHVFPQVVPLNTKVDPFQIWQRTSQRNHEERLLNASGVFANLRILADGAKSFGFFNKQPDPDGTFRRSPLLIRYNHDDFDFLYPSLDVEAVRQFRNIPDDKTIAYFVQDGIDHIQLGPFNLKPDYDGTALINYAGPYKTYKHYSMFDVVNGNFAPGTFKGKLVIYGATAIAVGDLRTTPFHDDDYTGVEIHANVIDNMLHSGEAGRGFITRGYKAEMIDVFFILAFGVGLGFFFSRTRPMVATVGAVAALFAFAWVTYLAFAHFGIWLSFVVPAGTLVANYATITSFRMIFEEREKRKVRKTFERYVSPGVISLIEKDPKKYFKTGGESKELTVMFSDIRDFTHLSEGLTPDELVRLLNEYLGDMTDILFHRWGTLDKYIGDALMGFWGSPFPQEDHAIRGCACALDMRTRLGELNAKWQSEGRKTLAIGIGLNTGVVNVGNMGSSKRFAWTVMGDNVNLASRLEGITKVYHVQCVVSEATYQSAKDHYVFREIDRITVKGKDRPVTIYELLDWGRNEASRTELIVRFSEALTAYRRQQWEEAIDLFNKILAMFPDDGPSRTFIERSRQYIEHPPAPEWDGVYAMTTK
jgi:adenylate cyclase